MVDPTPPSQPRAAHHMFAHRGLPHAFLRNPAGILGILASEDAVEFLAGMWRIVQTELPEDQHTDSAGLAVTIFPLADEAHAAVVTMPPPQRAFESLLVALVARLDPASPVSRVFSLVLTSPPTARPDAAVLEWTATGEHTFVADAAGADVHALLDVVEATLAGRSHG